MDAGAQRGEQGAGDPAPVLNRWEERLAAIARELRTARVHPARAVVLLPYAQLLPLAARLWSARFLDAFMPHFETTRSWAARIDAFQPDESDLVFDQGRDLLTAARLLEQTALRRERDALAAPLVAQAIELSHAACAVAPAERLAWMARATRVMPAAGVESQRYEALLARVALAWAGGSAYATDVLFGAAAARGVDRLFVVRGLEPDALTDVLLARFADRVIALESEPVAARAQVGLHRCVDSSDEAERAAACVLAHWSAGRTPVALVATDREVTRRVGAILASVGVQPGVQLRDETGWKLSTTHAAASVMAALRACASAASSDDVLDWVKLAPALAPDGQRELEQWLRNETVRQWSRAARMTGAPTLVAAIEALRTPLLAARSLAQWLRATRALLEDCGLWPVLTADAAGHALVAALGLDDRALVDWDEWPAARRRMELGDFARWVDAALEAATFKPPQAADAAVVVLPMSQLLDRPFAAVVVPGADEKRLPAVPEATGFWNDAQRHALGLPTREHTQATRQAAWAQVLAAPVADVLWCESTDQGEALQASPLVQLLAFEPVPQRVACAIDPRARCAVAAVPTPRPTPDGSELPMGALSATSYDMLRACPYRFFAKHLLGLGEASELDQDLEKRDWGLWVHAVLRRYHEALRDQPGGERSALLEAAARHVTRERGLDQSPGEFLPFKAAWPALRDAYLHWQQDWEARGMRFELAEEALHVRVGDIALRGRLDRIDRDAAGRRVLIDYKTEPRKTTSDRLKAGNEDTQLAFYALLSGDEAPRAAYLNLAEREEPEVYELVNLQALAAQLYEGMASDLQRIAARAPLLALGEGRICDYCEVRGLCRKDFWS